MLGGTAAKLPISEAGTLEQLPTFLLRIPPPIPNAKIGTQRKNDAKKRDDIHGRQGRSQGAEKFSGKNDDEHVVDIPQRYHRSRLVRQRHLP